MDQIYYDNRILWRADSKYTHHRIPGMIVTGRGTILAYCEARTGESDWALMDIMLQRSEDGGETFGAPLFLAQGTKEHRTVNNPVMVEDVNGRIHFMYCEDYGIRGGRICRKYSDDDGKTWSEAIDVTGFTAPQYRNAFAFGPGHGIRKPDGTLLIPVWMVPKHCGAAIEAHGPSVVSVIYSTDHGEKWHLGEILGDGSGVTSPNETEAALTSDGRVYLNLRHNGTQRAKAYGDTGYSDWREFSPDACLDDPKCFGSVAAYWDGVNPYTLLLANCDHKLYRKNVTVRGSLDDGRTWALKKVIDPDRGGYVECAVDAGRKRIYVLYEDKCGETDRLARFNYAWLQLSGS